MAEFTIKPPSPSINENVYEPSAGFEDNEFVGAARNALKAGRVAAEAAFQLAQAHHQDTLHTEPARHRNTRDAVYKATKPAVERLQNTIEKLDGKMKQLDNVLKGPTSMNNLLMTEIRTTLANMPREERRKQIIASMDDKEVMAAILRAPPFLSSLTPEEQADFRMRWAATTMPTEFAEREELAKISEHVERAGKLLVNYGPTLYSGHIIQQAEENARKVATATAAARTGVTH